MLKNGRLITLIALAVLLPPLIQAVVMIAFHGSPMLSFPWIVQYGGIFVLVEVAIGSVFLFRAFPRRYALLSLILYVPLMVLLIQGVGLFIAGAVFNDYL